MNDLGDILIAYFALWALSQVIISIIFAEKKDEPDKPVKRKKKKRSSDDDERSF